MLLPLAISFFCSDFSLLRADCWIRAKSLPIQNLLNLDKHRVMWIYQALTSCLDTSSVKSISSVLFRPVQYRKDISLILIFLHYSAESTSCVLFLSTIQLLAAWDILWVQVFLHYSAESTSCILFLRTIQHLAAEIFMKFKFSCTIPQNLLPVFYFYSQSST